MEADTKIQLEAVISQMIADGEKINVSRVAQKAGVSNALIYLITSDFQPEYYT